MEEDEEEQSHRHLVHLTLSRLPKVVPSIMHHSACLLFTVYTTRLVLPPPPLQSDALAGAVCADR